MGFGLKEIRLSLFPSQKKKQQRQEDISKSILPMRDTGEMFSYCLFQREGERRRKEKNQ